VLHDVSQDVTMDVCSDVTDGESEGRERQSSTPLHPPSSRYDAVDVDAGKVEITSVRYDDLRSDRCGYLLEPELPTGGLSGESNDSSGGQHGRPGLHPLSDGRARNDEYVAHHRQPDPVEDVPLHFMGGDAELAHLPAGEAARLASYESHELVGHPATVVAASVV
jgi:hypothetical protein